MAKEDSRVTPVSRTRRIVPTELRRRTYALPRLYFGVERCYTGKMEGAATNASRLLLELSDGNKHE
jgi:hypothetical protein